jgi:hypothetical protein
LEHKFNKTFFSIQFNVFVDLALGRCSLMRRCPQSERCRRHQKRHSNWRRRRDAHGRIRQSVAAVGSIFSTDRSGERAELPSSVSLDSRDLRRLLSSTFCDDGLFCRPTVATWTTFFRVAAFRRRFRDACDAASFRRSSIRDAFSSDCRDGGVVVVVDAVVSRVYSLSASRDDDPGGQPVVPPFLFLSPSPVLSPCRDLSLYLSHDLGNFLARVLSLGRPRFPCGRRL